MRRQTALQLLWLFESIMFLILFLENRVEIKLQVCLISFILIFLGSQWGDAGLCSVGTLPLSCLPRFLRRLIVAVGWLRFVHCWPAGGTCDVVLMVVPARGGFWGEHFWGMVGVIGCLWRVSPTLLEQACWRCLVVPVLFQLGVPLAISALGRDVLHPSCVLFCWADCVWVVVAWLLWSASGGVRGMCGRCGAYTVSVGVFSLCGCEMISGLLPRIYPHNFVNSISLKFLCTLSIEPLSLFSLSSFLCLDQGIFENYATHFSLVKFL